MNFPLILVVEDDPAIQLALRRGLSNGYKVVSCRTAIRAPRMAKKLRPFAIVLDAHLGHALNGFQICAILKQDVATRNIPVFMTSGRLPMEESAREALKRGAAAYIQKNDLWPELRERLDSMLRDGDTESPDKKAAESGLGFIGTVLSIDDDKEWLGLTERNLKQAGHRVVSTQNETTILELAERYQFDCVVLDYQLRRTTALVVCRMLQAHAATRALPVIIHTGHEKSKALSLGIGADQFVLKGGASEELLRSVSISIRRYHWSAGILAKGDVRLDRRDFGVYLAGRRLARLADNRFELLHALLSRSPQCVSREELGRALWGASAPGGESKALDKLFTHLKEDVGSELSRRIHHIKGLGWTYEMPLAPGQEWRSGV